MSGSGIKRIVSFIMLQIGMNIKWGTKYFFRLNSIFKFTPFQLFQDGDGLITAEEIQETMLGLGEDVSEAEVKAMVLEADLNGDGFIDFTEFSNLMKNSFGGRNGNEISQSVLILMVSCGH